MPKQTIYEELCETLKLELQDGEDYPAFARRAAGRLNKVSDAAWKELSLPLQKWANGVLQTLEENLSKKPAEQEPLPEMEGFPAEASGGGDDDEADQQDAEDNEAEGTEDEEGDSAEGEDESEASEESVDAEGDAEQDADDTQTDDSGAEEDAPPAAARSGKTVTKKPQKAAAKTKEKTTMRATERKAKTPAKKAGRKASIGDNDVIKVLATENPHRKGTKLYNYFAKYKTGMTVAAALKAKIPPKNIAYLKTLGHIKIIAGKADAA